jgi:hypothetical protein
MNTFFRVALMLALLMPSGLFAQPQLRPIDQAMSVPDFFTFRARLQAAIARRDAQTVLAALHKDVKLSFGGDAGIEDFKKIWRPHESDTPLWETLSTLLSLGGEFAPDNTFTAPYVFAHWPRDKDAFTHMAVVGSSVRVRSGPSATAPVIGSLDFAIVELTENPRVDQAWIQIKYEGHSTAYIDNKFLRSPIDYRINFAKLEGRWQVMFFLAGD